MLASVLARRSLAFGLALIFGLTVGVAVGADRLYLAALVVVVLFMAVMLKPANWLVALIIATPLFRDPV